MSGTRLPRSQIILRHMAKTETGKMNASAGHKLPSHGLFRAAVRLVDSSGALICRRWQTRFWIVLFWLLGIPLTTICFLSMLFWAYGVDG
jgi:hypothetical protein